MNLSAFFFGDGTLLIQCAEIFRQAGGSISGVVTADPQIARWADAEGLPLCGTPAAPRLGDGAADFVFSVANLSVLPAAILKRARKLAINFHDGPLPSRAGLNSPAWAILEGEREHAVTWHEMAGAVDTGRVLKTRQFAINATDTAFSLNARCYEAGLESFRELVSELASDRTPLVSSVGPRVSYMRAKRPDALGVLDLTRSSGELCRTVRGLNFGGYHNPLALAKLWTGHLLLCVRRLELAPGYAGACREVLSVDGDSIVVGALDASIRLSGLTDIEGEGIDPTAVGLDVGALLPIIRRDEAPEPIEIGKSEPDWEAALEAAAPALPPYARSHTAEEGTIPLTIANIDTATLVAGWLAWSTGLNGQQKATIAFHDPAARVPWLSDRRLVTLDLTACPTPEAARQALLVEQQIAFLRAPMAADLPLRLNDAETRRQVFQALSICFSDAPQETRGKTDIGLSMHPPQITVRAGLFRPEVLAALGSDFSAFMNAFAAQPNAPIASLPLGIETTPLKRGGTGSPARTIHEMTAASAAARPGRMAVESGLVRLTYEELESRAGRLAGALKERGAKPGVVVGLCLDRSADLVVAMLAILKSGAAYLPLDPGYPADRIAFMLADSDAPLIVASHAVASRLALDPKRTVFPDISGPHLKEPCGGPDDLAYLIYTSGSTGQPKGVMIAHRNVTNFFSGMDAAVPLASDARLLAVTSVSFDISVLEILWTLARGATVVLQSDGAGEAALPGFSLFYFASAAEGAGHHAYRLLLEGARFADENGFEAVWTPERHFHAFGGLYPNPAITSAVLAGITKNVKLRAGSVVAPLHHPVRMAEDWALIDNLSNGRAGIAIASGWQPNDFLLRPKAFANRKDIAFGAVETLRQLWRGEKLEFPGHDGKPVAVQIHPRPMQPELPLWLTAAGNPETFVAAGRLGCGVLTHLLGQTMEEVSEKIRSYRVARAEAGHSGPGHVVMMLHTFVAEEEATVREIARGPMKGYLKSAVDLMRRAAWTFPTFVERASSSGVSPQEIFEKEELSPSELDALLDHAFERYYHTSGLFGTPESAKEIVRKVAALGVDEIACLIDFGVDTDVVLENLPNIRTLMDTLRQEGGVSRKSSVAEDIVAQEITHLQCTPSMASYLAADAAGRRALAKLQCLMVGGEAFPPDLAQRLRLAMRGILLNMYGPTETTIWSSVAKLESVGERVPLGNPIANTVLSVRSPSGQQLPRMTEGELWIGGEGVAQGYWRRPELTAERFVDTPQGRFYRSGDLVRLEPDGSLEFLGRIDNQVKIRGHRIELGEIEALIADAPSVHQAAVKAVEFGPGDSRLVAYVTPGVGKSSVAELQAMLAAKLPDFMLPSQIVVLERMPLTPNGKIDRQALPAPGSPSERREITAAEGDVEAAIAKIWGEVLGLSEVSVSENFFDLGGHSLLVVQVQRRMKESLGRDIAITDMFRFPTIRSIAAHLSNETAGEPSAADRGAARAAARLARMGRRGTGRGEARK